MASNPTPTPAPEPDPNNPTPTPPTNPTPTPTPTPGSGTDNQNKPVRSIAVTIVILWLGWGALNILTGLAQGPVQEPAASQTTAATTAEPGSYPAATAQPSASNLFEVTIPGDGTAKVTGTTAVVALAIAIAGIVAIGRYSGVVPWWNNVFDQWFRPQNRR